MVPYSVPLLTSTKRLEKLRVMIPCKAAALPAGAEEAEEEGVLTCAARKASRA